jgi:hypothetical protein
MAADFNRSKVFGPEWHVGDKAKHQAVSVSNRLTDIKLRARSQLIIFD